MGRQLVAVQMENRDLQDRLRTQREEIDEYHQLTTRLSDLLTGVANVLKGPPPDLTWWDWSDLPAVSTRLIDALNDVHSVIGREVIEQLQPETVAEISRVHEFLWHSNDPDSAHAATSSAHAATRTRPS